MGGVCGRESLSRFERVLKELGVDVIHTLSTQAKASSH